MFFWISLIVLLVYSANGWTTIGPGLLFCLFVMVCETVSDLKTQVRKLADKLDNR